MSNNAETWTQRIAWMSLVALVAGGISWAGWATIELNSKIPRGDLELISPYYKDKAWINNELISLRTHDDFLLAKLDGEFSKTIRANTEAIILLKEQMKNNEKLLEKMVLLFKEIQDHQDQ